MRLLAAILCAFSVACTGPSPADAGFDVPLDHAADATGDDAAPAADARIIGVTTRTWTDTTRGTAANGDAGGSDARTLVTEVWYPALGVAGVDDETRDAPPDIRAAPYPVVLFVHGSSGTRRSSTFLTRALASSGYVVAAADFPLTTFSTPGGPSDLHVDDQLGDVRFLVDQLAAASSSPTDPLTHAVDASRYVVVGHSTGGTVALLAAFAPDSHDTRLSGAAALAPCACFFGDAFFTTRATPLLVIAGTDDRLVPIATNGARAYTLSGAPKDFVTLVGGNHLYFTDLRISDDAVPQMATTTHDAIAIALSRYGGGTACEPIPAAGTDTLMAFDAQHRHTSEWVRAFVDATLRAQGAGLAALRARGEPDLRVQSAQ